MWYKPDIVNLLHVKYLKGYRNIYFHLMSFLHIDMPQELKSFLV